MKRIEDIEEFVGQIVDTLEDYFVLHNIAIADKNPQEDVLFEGVLYDAVAAPIRKACKKVEDAIGLHIATLYGLRDATSMGGVVLGGDDLVVLNENIACTIRNWVDDDD